MNNEQLYLSIGIPTFAVLLAWLSNRADIQALRNEMTVLRTEMNKDMVAFRREVHEDFISFRREIHADMMVLHERVVRVETKQDNQ